MKLCKIFLLMSVCAGFMIEKSIVASDKSDEKNDAKTIEMVSLVPYYSQNGEYSMLLLKESDNKLHTAAMRKKETTDKSKYVDMLLQWIGEKFTSDKSAMVAEQGAPQSFESEDGTTVYLVRVKNTDVDDSNAQWVSETDLHKKAKEGSLSSDAKEVYLSKPWNDIVSASRKVVKNSTKGKSKKRKKVQA